MVEHPMAAAQSIRVIPTKAGISYRLSGAVQAFLEPHLVPLGIWLNAHLIDVIARFIRAIQGSGL